MGKENSYQESVSNIDLNRAFDVAVTVTGRPIIEIVHGIGSKSIDWFTCLVPGCVFNALVLTGWDTPAFRFIKMGWLLPPSGVWSYFIYCICGAMSGFGLWG